MKPGSLAHNQRILQIKCKICKKKILVLVDTKGDAFPFEVEPTYGFTVKNNRAQKGLFYTKHVCKGLIATIRFAWLKWKTGKTQVKEHLPKE